MGKHAEKLRDIVNNDLHEWAKELQENGAIDALVKARAMGPFSNALHLIEVTIGHVERAEAAPEEGE